MLKVLSLNSVSVAVNFVVGILSVKVISVFLGPSGMALLGSFRNFVSMAKSAGTLGINNSVVKLLVEHKSDPKALSEIYSTFFWLFLLIATVLAALLLVLAVPISIFLFHTDAHAMPVRFFALLLPLMAVNAFWMAVYNGYGKFRTIVSVQIIANLFVFAITALLIWKKHLQGGLIAMGVGEAVVFAVAFLFVCKDRSIFRFTLARTWRSSYLKVIGKFSLMALLSAILVPLTLLLVRNEITSELGLDQAGIWDAVNRLSGFYMVLFSSGLSLYYMPKLASLHSDAAFLGEIKSYYTTFVPLFLLLLIGIYAGRDVLLSLAFTDDFSAVKTLLGWQMLGDFVKMLTLAFGFQILVKARVMDYFVIEIVFNVCFFLLSLYFIETQGIAGALKAYALASTVCFAVVVWMFRNTLFKGHRTVS